MRLLLVIVSVVIGAIISASGFASDSEWQQHNDMLRTRIITASDNTESDQVLVAWEADLAPGWKTYWRSPGEAGLPVRVRVGDSEKEIQYPLPERFELFGLTTYGYKDRILLPFFVSRSELNEGLVVDASFMVCKDICVPFDSHYEINDELSSLSIHDGRIKSWMDKVPSKNDKAGLKINNVRITGKIGHQRLVVDVEADQALSKADLLAEGTGPYEFGVPSVKLVSDGTKARFVLPIMTMNKSLDIKGETLRFTLSDGKGNAIDRTVDTSS
ncbi:protein-disulfide reductase DsbD domain-containing protein [Kordiimonas sp. SCSIO 12610]|uniref:protein-disulfide reductase DsbD domain-containing protein n=1 Tax=Kordiimonas sp. SCSIO 12610 TaxID=2829597 RepID=UPI00210E2555|nr:protein-disulfide reductase DsbD domain-containing protein [Kordiimonas sp. SCSIO 12610]UTW54903.1 hypothetical protein KFF44_14000 [Kordiimonas sp. SCSIO 12610]